MGGVDYNKLLEDLRAARAAAIARVEGMEDGYPFNYDAAALRLPHARKEKVLAIISDAGLEGTTPYRSSAIHIRGPVPSHSRLRTEQAIAIVEVLSARGWDVGLHTEDN